MLALISGTAWFLLSRQPMDRLLAALSQVRPQYILLGLGLMAIFVGCEAMCSKLILGRLGHRLSYRTCLGYSYVGFYVSSITPSSTGGQPAQIYYMSKDGVPPAHGSLNMMLIAVCYQVVSLLYAVAAFVGLRQTHQGMGAGLGALLLVGGGVLVVLTAGMLCMMFLPHAARRLTGGILKALVRLRLVKREAEMRQRLECQMEEYRQGAVCLKENLSLLPALLGLTALQITSLYAVPYMVYLGFGLSEATFFQLVGTQALVNLAVGFLPLPGAVGASEGVALTVFTHFFGAGLVTPAVLVSRGISFYAFLLISGVVSLSVHLRTRPPKNVAEAPQVPAADPSPAPGTKREHPHVPHGAVVSRHVSASASSPTL